MTTFNYTTGNPSNLAGGQPASMNDIAGPFTDVRTFLNGGNIDTANLATSAKPVTLLGQYRTISEVTAQGDSGDSSGIKQIVANSTSGWELSPNGNASSSAHLLIPIDPADFAVSGLSTRFRVRAIVATNATAPAITYTFGLYPVTVAGGAGQIAVTLGTVVSGSTVAIATPSASTATSGVGSDFAPPSAGVYALGVSLSGNAAASSYQNLTMVLQVRHI